MEGTAITLFDGQPARPKTKTIKTSKTIKPFTFRKKSNQDSSEGNRPKVTRDERRRITEAYERGEIKFPDVSGAFLLCHCCVSPDYHSYPHAPHRNEEGVFELQHYGKRKK